MIEYDAQITIMAGCIFYLNACRYARLIAIGIANDFVFSQHIFMTVVSRVSGGLICGTTNNASINSESITIFFQLNTLSLNGIYL